MKRIIGIGETVLDIIFRNNQPVSAVPGGSTFNSMISLGRAGARCLFISETGDDRIGDIITNFLAKNGVDNSMVQRNHGQHAPLSLAFLDEQMNADYIFYKDHAHDAVRFQYPEIHDGDLVLFGSFYALNPVIREQVGGFLRYAREQGAILYYDVNFRASHRDEIGQIEQNLLENLRLAHIVRGSDEDFEILFGLKSADEVYAKLQSAGAQPAAFIYTRGNKPVQMYCGTQRMEYAFEPVEAVSTIGAGDNFNAGLLFELYRQDIGQAQIEAGLTEEQWLAGIKTAARFSRACCLSLENYIPEHFNA